MNIRLNPCDGVSPKEPKLYVSSFELAGFAGFREEISLHIPSCDTLLFDSSGLRLNVRPSPRNGIFLRKGLNYTFQVSNWQVLMDLERKMPLIYVVVFQCKGRKSSFSVPHFVFYSFGPEVKSTCWHFYKKAQTVRFKFQTCRFCLIWSRNKLVVFQRKHRKSSISVPHLTLSYSILRNLE